MAHVDKNAFLKGVSGSVGKTFVIRTVGDKTIMAIAPGKRTKSPSAKQVAHQDTFKSAANYGKAVMANPVDKGEYGTKKRKPFESEYNLAVTDFLTPPQVLELDTAGYKGKKGELIRVRATDDFAVKSVKVQVLASDGSLFEEGLAVSQTNGLDWLYKGSTEVLDMTGAKVVATATDKPGNTGVLEKVM